MNAIISAATGYKPAAIDVFMYSAAKHCRDTTLYIMVLEKDWEKFSARFCHVPNVTWIRLPRKLNKGVKFYYRPLASFLAAQGFPPRHRFFESLGRFPLHIAVERYFYALEIIRADGNSLSNVMLCDSRDVVIQKNPFETYENSLICGVEEKKLGECPFNADWIKHIYSEPAVVEMASWQIVCSGVTLGPAKEIEEYLVKMCAEIWQNLPNLLRPWWIDQGVHNRLIFNKTITCALTGNHDGIIATLGYEDEKKITIDKKKNMVCVAGKYPAIVHQYDRIPFLIDFYKHEYALPIT